MKYLTIIQENGRFGHQLNRWVSGFILSHLLGMKYIHFPFVKREWESFFNFGEYFTQYKDIHKNIPKIDVIEHLPTGESIEHYINQINNFTDGLFQIKTVYEDSAIHSLNRPVLGNKNLPKKIYKQVIRKMKCAYNTEMNKKGIVNYFDKTKINIGVHIRRGDVANVRKWRWRYQSVDYFYNILESILRRNNNNIPINIHIYSDQINTLKNSKLSKLNNVFFSQGDQYSDFYHLTRSDVILTSISDFSNMAFYFSKAMAISSNSKMCSHRKHFRKVIVNDNNFNVSKVIKFIKKKYRKK